MLLVQRWAKVSKVGEVSDCRPSLRSAGGNTGLQGTYAVVYRGKEVATGRPVAIKKLKVGQFKDGLDMSAIREVKYLQELHHPNIIQVSDL